MGKFLELEAGYLFIGFVILAVTLFVSSRPFFKKGSVIKAMLSVGLFWGLATGWHFHITTSRMDEVKSAFNAGEMIICESRATRKVAQSVNVNINNDWRLEGDVFASPNYNRVFHSARCILPLKRVKTK